jgi:hypothetical protein
MKKLLTPKWTKLIGISLLVLATVFSAVAFVPSTVFAQTAVATANVSAQSTAHATRIANLEKAYNREQNWLTTQAANLQKMNQVGINAQKLLDNAKAKGLNVDILQDALNIFNAQIPNALSLHNTAMAILSTHDGFDANGKVTNTTQASLTILEARQSLNDAHTIMVQAIHDLRAVIRSYRLSYHLQANQPALPSPTTPTSGG